MEILEQNKKRIGYALFALFVLLIILSVYFAIKIFSDIKNGGLGDGDVQPATISFSGHGEVTAVPDIATVYFTISKDAKTVKSAQENVATIEQQALTILKAKNVAEKDIKTADASFYPRYEYKRICPTLPVGDGIIAPRIEPGPDCYNGKQVIVGYTASESITVKIRNTDDAGTIMQSLGTVGVSNLSGPNFTIDNEDSLKIEARQKAIDDAKDKAKELAKALGVRLGKITNFSENGNYPVMYATKGMMFDSASSVPAPAQLPKGENTISSDVTITYEIK